MTRDWDRYREIIKDKNELNRIIRKPCLSTSALRWDKQLWCTAHSSYSFHWILLFPATKSIRHTANTEYDCLFHWMDLLTLLSIAFASFRLIYFFLVLSLNHNIDEFTIRWNSNNWRYIRTCHFSEHNSSSCGFVPNVCMRTICQKKIVISKHTNKPE